MCWIPSAGQVPSLLSCGLRGAFCVGTDIDIRVIRGHSQEKSVVGNFFQYKLPRPEIIRCDNHSYKRHWRLTTSNLYDAIVCDPPYGIRTGARKSGSKRNVIKPVVDRHDHIAQTQPYDVADSATYSTWPQWYPLSKPLFGRRTDNILLLIEEETSEFSLMRSFTQVFHQESLF